jgi:hypothetical protein
VERCRHLCSLLFADEELLSVAIEARTRGAFAGLNSIGHKNGNRGPAILSFVVIKEFRLEMES